MAMLRKTQWVWTAGLVFSTTLACAAGPGDVMHRASLAVDTPAVPTFAIRDFKVDGNTLLDPATVAATVAPFRGDNRDFGDVQRAMEALEAAYRTAGYAAVGVLLPEQVLESGVVTLRVVEGKIKRIEVTGNQHFDSANILASVPALQVGKPPAIEDISASLRVANENPAKTVALKLEPGEGEGDLDAKLEVTDRKPWQVGLTLDNTGTDSTGSYRLGVSYQHSNLFNRDQVLTLQYQTAPDEPSNVNVYALAYRFPLYARGDAIDLYVSKSDVDAGSVSAGPFSLAITGRGTAAGAKYSWKLKRLGDLDQEIVFGFERKTFENGIGLGTAQLGNKVAVNPLSVQYNARWSRGDRAMSGSASLVQNVAGGAHGDTADFESVRTGADKNYNLLRGSLTFSQALARDWQGRISLAAQYSGEALIPGEQFGIGGAQSVRGFDEREVASDKGVMGNLEVFSPEICSARFSKQQCRAVVFYDWGAVYRNKSQPSDVAREHLSSIGLGLRWSLTKDLAFQADYANVLQGGGQTDNGDWKFHARLGWFF